MWHPSVTDLLPVHVVIKSLRRTVSQPPSALMIPLAAGELDYAKPHSAPFTILSSVTYHPSLSLPQGFFQPRTELFP